MQFGGLNDKAHELRVNDWIDLYGKPGSFLINVSSVPTGSTLFLRFHENPLPGMGRPERIL